MKTLFINCSSKKRFSNSNYFLSVAKFFTIGPKHKRVKMKLPLNKRYETIFKELNDCDQLVLAMPVYVDGIPSHVLRFLKACENYCKENQLSFNVYVISNCGFFEGSQNKLLHRQIKLWCKKTKLTYQGGLGIGAGEMLGFLRFLVLFYLLLTLLFVIKDFVFQIINQSFSLFELYNGINFVSLGYRFIFPVVVSLTAFIFLIRIGLYIRTGKSCRTSYTTVFCPKFLFTIFASIYWLLRLCIINRRLPWRVFDKQLDFFAN